VRRPSRRRPPPGPYKPRRPDPDARESLLHLLRGFHLCSREYLFRHYDSEVRGLTWLRPGEADAVVIQLDPQQPMGAAFAVGGNPWWCENDPELGARHAVAEAARNVACTGGRPWALTDCLNFGSPEDPGVMGDFEATLEGLAVAAESLGGLAARGSPLPFVSGNVSLHNQASDRAIPPSPVVMCAGVVRDVSAAVPRILRAAGDFLVVVGEPRDELTGSAYVRECMGARAGAPPSLDLAREARLQELAVLAAEGRWVRAAHDISDGGLAVALAEMVMGAAEGAALGVELNVAAFETRVALALYSERPGIVFEVPPERAPRLFQAARERSLLAWPAGSVIRLPMLRALLPDVGSIEWTADELRDAASSALESLWNEELE
jgi:phosphoribosylformylglycinamidine synthase